ncbi:hypothetical protein ACHAXT_011403 [Thalassiosira profunda]
MLNLGSLLSAAVHAKLALRYLHRNAWTIVFIIAGSYLLYGRFIDPFLHEYRARQSYKSATDPNRVAVLAPDMRRIRAKQQEETMQKSIEAAEEKKKKLAGERARKRVKTPEEERWERLGGEGNRLGEEDEGLRQRR